MKRALILLLLSLTWTATLPAAEVKIFRTQSREDFLEGTLDGISLDPLGRLRLADEVQRLTTVDEPFLLSAAVHPEGWVLGTGNSGRVLLVDRGGGTRELFATEEPEVFAVWADDDGTVFAGSSPSGKVYRYRDGETTVFFDPGEDYIWALARARDGALLAATGTRGRLYAIAGAGRGEIFFDADDTHLRCLEVLPGGEILLGTAGEGLVLRLSPEGQARTLYDGERPEVVDFAVDPEGGVYVASLASEASLVPPTQSEGEQGSENGGEEGGTAKVTVSGEGAMGSRLANFTGARSEIVYLARSGAVDPVSSFQDETVYALIWHRDRLWIGTGLEGKLYSRHDEKLVMEEDVDERQIVVLLADDPGPAFGTTNAAALYRLEARPRREGTYTSPVLDAGQVARFGSLRWYGEPGAKDGPLFSVRSGISSEPDRTWSEWTPAVGGQEVDISGLPRGRYTQWRAELVATGSQSPRIDTVLLSYRQDNVRPQITSLTVLEPGKVMVPASFNPAHQVFEPASPNREGIFTTLNPAAANENGRTKTLWKKGYRTLQWEAEDANDDELRHRLEFRADRENASWLTVVDGHEESWFSFDAAALPDGLYRFRLTVSDEGSNLPGEGLQRERLSEPVVVDHSPPVLVGVEREQNEIRVRVRDAWSPLREAVQSLDAGEWRPVRVADELLDEQAEELILEVDPQAELLLLRLTDAAHNVVTHDLSSPSR